MDYRLTAEAKPTSRGIAQSRRPCPSCSAKIIGTAPLKKVVVVRDNEYIYSKEPDGDTFDLRYRENVSCPGNTTTTSGWSRRTGNVVWSSPIWIDYTK